MAEVHNLEAAQACFAGGAAAFDCVLLEHSLLAGAPPGAVQALFTQAAAVHAPVVLMAGACVLLEGGSATWRIHPASACCLPPPTRARTCSLALPALLPPGASAVAPSQCAVLEGVHLGAADFLERPLSFHKLRTLWQHKIRAMMHTASGGSGLAGSASCPQLTTAAATAAVAAPADTSTASAGGMPSLLLALPGGVQGLSCPATPAIRAISCPVPQPSCSLGSGDSGVVPAEGAPPAAPSNQSDASSIAPATPAASAAINPTLPALQPVPAAPLACLWLGATPDLLPAAVHWPGLPDGTTWGTPLGCGVAPPHLPGSPAAGGESAAAAPPPAADLAIRWCPPGALPMPATTYELLLPEDFSLARPAAEARERGAAAVQRGPLGLRLTVSPDLLADISSCLGASAARGGAAAEPVPKSATPAWC